jgi:hypothetical protein
MVCGHGFWLSLSGFRTCTRCVIGNKRQDLYHRSTGSAINARLRDCDAAEKAVRWQHIKGWCMINSNTLALKRSIWLYVPLFPNFSNARGPISSHSSLVTHLYPKYQHQITRRRREKGGTGGLHIGMILHNIGKHRPTQKDHMPTPGRILDPNAEL